MKHLSASDDEYKDLDLTAKKVRKKFPRWAAAYECAIVDALTDETENFQFDISEKDAEDEMVHFVLGEPYKARPTIWDTAFPRKLEK